MTSPIDEVGTATRQLRELVDRGFRFLHPTDSKGAVIAVVGVRQHDNVIDVVVLRTETEAKAARMPSDEKDILAPTRTLWQATGRSCVVLRKLSELPDEYTPDCSTQVDAKAPEPAAGCWVPVRPGNTKWLAYTC
ncbi:MAG TPA: hypothetical protein VHX38_21725 [Pseudonocardiaceae bacterium]|jgi:hypothetical protein|nr:hypothetical protein [Pseudonocardiaceae bacterium]